MSKRLLGAVLLAVLAFAGLAAPAVATEEEHGGPSHAELPKFEELGTQSDTAKEFFPEPPEEPTVFPWFGWPLMIGALLLSLWVLLSYLVFQPRFDKERKAKAAGRKK